MAIDLYEREVKVIMENGGVERLKKQYMILSKHLDTIFDENKGLKEKISELENKLEHSSERIKAMESMFGIRSAKENIELANKLYGLNLEVPMEEEPLPFSDEQCKEETKVELPTMPIDVASMLINARNGLRDKYSKDDLQEIIEHLRAFIDNPSDD